MNVNLLLTLNGLSWLGCFMNYLRWWREAGEGYFLTSEILQNKRDQFERFVEKKHLKWALVRCYPGLVICLVSTLIKSPGNFSSLMWDGVKQVPLEDLGWSQALFIVFRKYYRGKIFSWVAKHQRE